MNNALNQGLVGRGSMQSAQCVAERQTDLQSVCENLSKEVTSLEEVVGAFIGRVQCVSRNEPGCPEKQPSTSDYRTEVTVRIGNSIERLSKLKENVTRQLQLLEV